MNNRNRNVLSLGLSLALCAPVAMAQDVNAKTTVQSELQADANVQAEAGKVTWAELDADADGMLSATEAAGIERLGDSFDDADADDDGLLTADEYRDWFEAQPDTTVPPAANNAGTAADASTEASTATDAGIVDDSGETTDDGSSDQDPGADQPG